MLKKITLTDWFEFVTICIFGIIGCGTIYAGCKTVRYVFTEADSYTIEFELLGLGLVFFGLTFVVLSMLLTKWYIDSVEAKHFKEKVFNLIAEQKTISLEKAKGDENA